jgi:lipopolysaccharide export system ATP-binding protein
VVGLLGPTAPGKTTSFYMLVGLLPTEGGRIFLEGREITALPMYQRCRMGVGYLPQESSVFRKLTVEENLLAILETLDLGAAERKERARELLAELDLTALAPYPAYTLSGGERRRLEITRRSSPARSTCCSTSRSPASTRSPSPTSRRSSPGCATGVLASDHRPQRTRDAGHHDRAYILYDGKILVSGTASEIASSPIAREIYLGEKFAL